MLVTNITEQFQALTVPMHLGLIEGPFVPHNLILDQDSSVSLPMFQMAPRLKILMSPVSKKGIKISFSILSKIPANEAPIGSPKGPLWTDIPVYRVFFISLEILMKFPLNKKALRKKAFLHIPQTRGPYGSRCPFPSLA
jgi:hypothetical protein